MANLLKFVKDYVFIRTLSGYNFLFGVSVGCWLGLVGLYRDCIGTIEVPYQTLTLPLPRSVLASAGSVLEPSPCQIGTRWQSVPDWN